MGTRFSVTMLALLTSSMVAGMTLAAQRGAPATQQTTQTYRAPRTKDGKPDLNGIWQAVNEANWDIEATAPPPVRSSSLAQRISVAPGLGIVEGGAHSVQARSAGEEEGELCQTA